MKKEQPLPCPGSLIYFESFWADDITTRGLWRDTDINNDTKADEVGQVYLYDLVMVLARLPSVSNERHDLLSSFSLVLTNKGHFGWMSDVSFEGNERWITVRKVS